MEDGLSDVVDDRIVQRIQQHQGDDGQRSRLSDISRLIEAELDGAHPAQIDPLGKAACAPFRAEAGKAVYAFVAKASISIAGRVMQHEQRVRNGFF